MTHPNPPAEPKSPTEPESTLEPVASGATKAREATGKPARKAPPRVTAAAGAPASTRSSAPAILVFDANGMMVPATATPTDEQPAKPQDPSDAENSPAADAAPIEVAESESPAPEAVPVPVPVDALPIAVTDSASDTESAIETLSTSVEAVEVPASQSRRERRLAEQQEVDGTTSAAVVPTDSGSTALDTTDSKTTDTDSPRSREETAHHAELNSSAKPPRKRNRLIAFFRGLFFLVVISALVVAMGTVLSGPDVNAGDQSPTQAQRQVAWETTTKLHSEALLLADASNSSQLQKALSTTAEHLGLQAAALSDGLPAPAPTASSTSTATELASAPLSITGLVQDLSANAETLLGNALTAEHSMGRVFASVGTSQLLQSAELAAAAGSGAPTSKYVPALVDFPSASGPSCTSTLEPRPGVTVDSALRAVAVAEQKAVYAYQVASTRFAEPQFSKATGFLARHQQKLDLLNAELRLRCLPLADPVAGFDLDSTFTTLPKQALSILEVQLSFIYGELAALSTAPEGTAPDADRSATAAESAALSSPAPVSTEDPLKGSRLRELAVLWLLDSTQAHTSWGGAVEALPGIAPVPVISPAPAG